MGVYDMSQYRVKIIQENKGALPKINSSGMPVFQLGERITVEWTAPLNHGSKDWIGIYKVSSNASFKSTNVASKGRYLYINREGAAGLGEAEEGIDDHAGKGDGEVTEEEVVWVDDQEICRSRVVFLGDKLPWFEGQFEFRYHHHDRYNVMAYTVPFEISLESADPKELSIGSIGQKLLTYVQRCFNLDEDTMPVTLDEKFVMINQTIAERIVKGIHLMYGIEFAWEVVAVDMCCLHLAMRILTARRALAPFSYSPPSVSPSTMPTVQALEEDVDEEEEEEEKKKREVNGILSA
ncbi:phosphatidylethanolamine N-methyltransferase [Mortierella claussenii]|nr:phosphatidylethanolamine N-methyltransferase [Mortierella claussenii]